MPSELEIWIDATVTRGNQAYAICHNLMNYAGYLGDSLTAENWSGAATAAYQMQNAFNDLRDYGHFRRVAGQYYNALALYWINDNWGTGADPYELTMEKILEAIWASNPLETFFFVNYIDAMRAAIWNKEISEEKLHELYRHFT